MRRKESSIHFSQCYARGRIGLFFLFLIFFQGAAVCSALVARLALESDRASTIQGLDIKVKALAFDAADNPVESFDVAFDVVEGAAGGTLGANEDCDGEPAGSGHCVTYTPPADVGIYQVRATLDADPSITAQWEIEVVACAPYPADGGQLNCTGPIISPAFDHKGDIRLAVILLEPKDFASADDADRQSFRDAQTERFFGAGDSVKTWFSENGIGKARLLGDENDVYGPYVMAENWDRYFQPNGQLRWSDGHGLCFQVEGVVLADPDIDYTRYNRVYFVVRGDNAHNVWGWTNSVWNKTMAEGCIKIASCRDGSLSAWQVGGHEFSHTLLMTQGMGWTPDLYGGADPRKVDGYDIMHQHMSGSQHTMPIKWAGEWVPSEDVFAMPRPVGSEEKDETVVIGASEVVENDPAVFKTVIVPITDRKKIFIAARKTIPGNVSSQNLPDDGVIITDWTPNPAIIGEDRAQILLLGKLLAPGDEYDDQDPVDPTRRLNVSLISINGNNYTVRIRWRQFRADPFINPWEPPPWQSIDIWNDSPLNNEGGAVVYADADASGEPVGRGDEPSYGVANTLFARIHNGGNQDAAGVVVNFYWVDPTIGDPPWNFIGMDSVDVPQNGSAVAETSWIPISNPAHQCVKVIINPYPGELNPSNNSAQENFHVQASPSGSPYRPATMTVNVNNPFNEPTFAQLGFSDLPEGWKIQISKSYVHLAARETKPVDVTITPPESSRDKRPQSTISIYGEAYRLTYDDHEIMKPIGGVTILTRGVDPVPTPALTVDPQTVSLGASVQARVHAFPLTQRPMAVVFKGPGGAEEIKVGRTDANRIYETDFIASIPGLWTAQARFMGDDRNASAESALIQFTVVSKEGAGGADDCINLCPRDYIILVIIIVLLLILVVLVVRMHGRLRSRA